MQPAWPLTPDQVVRDDPIERRIRGLPPCRGGIFMMARSRWLVQRPTPSQAPERMRAPERMVVEDTGIEPVTSWLQTRRSPG